MIARRCAQYLWTARIPLFAAAAVATVFAGSYLKTLTSSNSLEIWFPEGDPLIERYAEFQNRFGNDDVVVVAVTDDAPYVGVSGQERAAGITDRLYYVDGVRAVTSISTVPHAMTFARDRLLSENGNTAVFVVQFGSDVDTEARRPELLEALRAAASREGEEARLAGYGVIYAALNKSSTEDAAALLVAAHLVMVLILAVFFRQWQTVFATVAVVSCATVWTMGLYAFLGLQLNMVTMALPTLVLVISVANCVHVFRAVARQPGGASRRDRTVNGIASILAPCFWTSLTTACGFLALTVSAMPVLRSLGQFGAIGMLSGFAAAFAILPVLLSCIRVRPITGDGIITRLAIDTHDLARRHPRRTVSIFGSVLVIALLGLTDLETDTYSIGYLADDHQTRRESDFIEARVGAYAPVDFVVEADDVLAPSSLDQVQEFQNRVSELDEVAWTWSVLDAIEIDRASRPSALDEGEVSARIARLKLLAPGIVSTMAAEDRLRISIGVPMMSARELRSLIERIETLSPAGNKLDLRAEGYAALYTAIVDRLVRTQVAGFAVALAIIVGIVALVTRSLGCTLLAIPANLIPVAGTLGLMGWLDVPLDVATATIATVILGLIVDDTMHVLRPASEHRELPELLAGNVALAGGALLITSVVLIGGFLILGLASLRSVAWFGGLSAFAIALALATDLVLLPALATLCRVRRGASPDLRKTLIKNEKIDHQSILRES